MDQTIAQVERKQQEQAQAIADIETALAAIEARSSQLDDWERTQLGRAIELLRRGAYEQASRFAKYAVMPAAVQSPNMVLSPLVVGCGRRRDEVSLDEVERISI